MLQNKKKEEEKRRVKRKKKPPRSSFAARHWLARCVNIPKWNVARSRLARPLARRRCQLQAREERRRRGRVAAFSSSCCHRCCRSRRCDRLFALPVCALKSGSPSRSGSALLLKPERKAGLGLPRPVCAPLPPAAMSVGRPPGGGCKPRGRRGRIPSALKTRKAGLLVGRNPKCAGGCWEAQRRGLQCEFCNFSFNAHFSGAPCRRPQINLTCVLPSLSYFCFQALHVETEFIRLGLMSSLSTCRAWESPHPDRFS